MSTFWYLKETKCGFIIYEDNGNNKNNIINAENITWRDLIQATLEFLQNKATIDEIYNILIKSKKAQRNNHIREKIRQTLNSSSNFTKQNDRWSLCIENI